MVRRKPPQKTPAPRHFIKQWRKHRGLTQDQLGERIGRDRSYVSKIEKGRKRYDQPFLEATAEALRCEPGDLIMRDPTKEDSLWSIWSQIPPEAKPIVTEMMKGAVKKAAAG